MCGILLCRGMASPCGSLASCVVRVRSAVSCLVCRCGCGIGVSGSVGCHVGRSEVSLGACCGAILWIGGVGLISSSCGDGWLVSGSVDSTEICVDMLDTFSCSFFGALYAFANGATMNFQSDCSSVRD